MPSGSRVIDFLGRTNSIVERDRKDVTLTHLIMDGARGGRVCLRPEDEARFFDAYGEDLDAGARLCFIEKRSPVFKLHFDLDLPSLISREDAVRLVDACNDVVASFLDAVVYCVACAVLEGPGRQERRAPGLHLIWPEVAVDETWALWIRASAVHRLSGDPLDFDWNKVVDISVLTTSGLRMVGSDKCHTCRTCNNHKTRVCFCGDCSRAGKIYENKIYWPWLTRPDNPALLAELVGNRGHGARVCSTRLSTSKPDARLRVPAGAPPQAVCRELRGAKRRPDDRERYLDDGITDTVPRCSARPIRLELLPRTKELVEACVREYHPAYAELQVRDVHSFPSRRRGAVFTITVKVTGPGSRYCLNKQDDHSSNTIYFHFTIGGVAQKCFSQKDTPRCSGECCRDFVSELKPLSEPLRQALLSAVGVESFEEAAPPAKRGRLAGDDAALHLIAQKMDLHYRALPACMRDQGLQEPRIASAAAFERCSTPLANGYWVLA
jgi:hypothetical protein